MYAKYGQRFERNFKTYTQFKFNMHYVPTRTSAINPSVPNNNLEGSHTVETYIWIQFKLNRGPGSSVGIEIG